MPDSSMEQVVIALLHRIEALEREVAALKGFQLMPSYTFDARPATLPDRALAIINNARKPGEGAGAGTGVLAMYRAGVDWLRVGDYTVVAA